MFNFGKVYLKLIGGISSASESLPALVSSNLLRQPSRSTFVLKRKYPLKLLPKGGRLTNINHKAYAYELVHDTSSFKKKPVNIILTKDIPGQGQEGDRLSVKPYSAYNDFLLPGLAVYASPENMEKFKDITIEKKPISTSPTVTKTIHKLSITSVAVVMSIENEWTLERWHVKAAFRKCGIVVPEEAITMPEKSISGPDMSIENKEFYVTVTINKKDKCVVRCRIHHYSPDPSKQLPYVTDFWKQRVEPIFPEDKAVLDSLPRHAKWL